MDNCTTTAEVGPNDALPVTDLGRSPTKFNKRLGVTPAEFLEVAHAATLAEWGGDVLAVRL